MDIETGLAEEKNNSVVQKSSLKVFIPHVPAGAGHQRAAEAIGIALRALHPQDQVTVVNAADQSDSFYQWAFSRGYLGMIQYMPVLWGALYYLTDFQALAPVWKKVHRLSNWLHGRQFEQTYFSPGAYL